LPAQARDPASEQQRTAIHLASAPVPPSEAEAIRQRVANALRADPYLYDRHVTVSVEEGRIVLRGFVFGDWDLRNALRIARQSAGGLTVVDNLSIKEGGRS
jgi:osmotically-inducible protein OsmY